MSDDAWPYVPLGELVAERITYGIVQPGQATPDGTPILRVKDIRGGWVDTRDPLRVSPDIAERYARTMLVGGEVLLTLVGTVGEVAVAPHEVEGWNVARAISVIRPTSDVGSQWISLALRAVDAQRLMKTWMNTTVQATLNLRDVARIPIPLPPRHIRDAISAVATLLDQRAALNRRMFDTLERYLATLFAARFVEFADAVELVDSQIGPIPPSWSIRTLGDVAVRVTGSVLPNQTPDEVFQHFSIPAYDDGQIATRDLGEAMLSGKTPLSDRTVLVSKLNPQTRRVWDVRPDGKAMAVCSPEFVALVPRDVPTSFLQSYLRFDEGFWEHVLARTTGTTGSRQRVRPQDDVGTPCASLTGCSCGLRR